MSFFIFMGVFSLFYFLGSISEINQNDAVTIVEGFSEIVEDIDTLGIFSKNTSIALPMFIPGFGIVWGSISAWSTGHVFSAIQSMTPAMANFPSLALLFLSPFGILELFAYSLAMSRSFLVTKSIIQKTLIKKQLVLLAIEIVLLVGVLFVAAVIEDYVIHNMEFFPDFMIEE